MEKRHAKVVWPLPVVIFLLSRLGLAALLLWSWTTPAAAAVMPFSDLQAVGEEEFSLFLDDDDRSFGLQGEESAEGSLTDARISNSVSPISSDDALIENVLGLSSEQDWESQISASQDRSNKVTALELMRAYVNVVQTSRSNGGEPDTMHRQNAPNAGGKTGSGRGFLVTLAEEIDDPESLSLVTSVLQPHIGEESVTFSVLGFGRFLFVSDGEDGDIAIVNANSGNMVQIHDGRNSHRSDERASGAASAGQGGPIADNEGETTAQLLLLGISLISNPMFIFFTSLLLAIWLLVRIVQRMSVR